VGVRALASAQKHKEAILGFVLLGLLTALCGFHSGTQDDLATCQEGLCSLQGVLISIQEPLLPSHSWSQLAIGGGFRPTYKAPVQPQALVQ
jgi:hypothetical protein